MPKLVKQQQPKPVIDLKTGDPVDVVVAAAVLQRPRRSNMTRKAWKKALKAYNDATKGKTS
jgi:hypothetical protein